VPQTDCAKNLATYRKFHAARCAGLILSAHDVSEGGLITSLAEMGFSGKGGLEVDLYAISSETPAVSLFSESTGRILIEVATDNVAALQAALEGESFAIIGKTSATHADLVIRQQGTELMRQALPELKATWQHRLAEFY
jgi:phosphoribosylformylglycinamidine synthase